MDPPTEDRGSGSTDTGAQDTGAQGSGAKDITIFAETGGKRQGEKEEMSSKKPSTWGTG